MKEEIFLLSFLFFYSAFFQIVAGFILESGIYITEQGTESYFTGGTLRTIAYHFFFFLSLIITFKIIKKISTKPVLGSSKNEKDLYAYLYLLFISIILVILFINVFFSPSPLFNDGITRFNFWENAKFKFLKTLFGGRSMPIVMLLGMIYAYAISYHKFFLKRMSLVLFIIFIIYQYSLGEKFTNQVIATIFMFLPAMLIYQKLHKSLKKIIIKSLPYILLLLLLLFSIIYYYYLSYDLTKKMESPILAILYRAFVLQGHMQWGLDNLFINLYSNIDHLHYFSEFIKNNFDGMTMAMYLVSPQATVDAYLNQGIRFSSAYPGVGLMLFGPYGLVLLQIIFGIIVAFFLFYYYAQIIRCNIIRGFASGMILLSIFTCYNMGDFSVLFSKKVLFAIGIIVISEILLFIRNTYVHISINDRIQK
ncbi:DUF6418 domain-containing protein [Hydrogenimonas sp.]